MEREILLILVGLLLILTFGGVRGRNTFISCLSRMGVALEEHICFQDTKCLTGPDKPISNLSCNFKTLYQIPYLQDYKFKVNQISCSKMLNWPNLTF